MNSSRTTTVPGRRGSDVRSVGASKKLVLYVCLAFFLMGFVYAGKDLRKWTWQLTAAVRYQADIENAFLWGQFSNIVGVTQTYDKLVERHGGDYSHHFMLDYPPFRLLVAATWTELLQKIQPGIRAWRNEYVLTFPLLYFNYLMQLVTSVSIFLLVRAWYLRHTKLDNGGAPVPFARASVLAGLTAASLFLLNPAVILNSHGWPQWDSWLIAFFAAAVLAATYERWFLAGACIGMGCLFKGQILVVAPILPLLAVFEGKWREGLVFLLGWLATALLLVLPWLLRDPWAAAYIAVATALGAGLVFRWAADDRKRWQAAGLAGAGVFCVAAVSTLVIFDTSMAWFHIGYGYGVRRNTPYMVIGTVPNLAELLHYYFDIRSQSHLVLPFVGRVAVTTFLILGYLSCLVFSAWRAARFKQAGDGAFLLAVFSPWLFMFAFMPYMHERYLVYVAAFSATWVFLGVIPVFAHVVLVALSFGAMLHMMLLTNPDAAPELLHWFNGVYPEDSWLVVALAMVLLLRLARKPRATPMAGTAVVR